ncbi:PREDICTED: type 1 phosphatases regulator YPI1 [Drosophila arizonae]|uniref:E3 ubiquitin-protein ligase PPP1R11 n=1 Tax=Drosophila arizonae TaxID=7263 RepID=A0ABM1PS36_DROAR|nr:PREDICTED: type 1 phosphatases regulator YPI1 [Drosophila arizonae]
MEEQPSQPIRIERDSSDIIGNGLEIASGSSGLTGTAMAEERPSVSGVHLLLMCLDSDRHVTFQEGVIDNEGMNRRKSKCCCIYRKPHAFGESSSSSDDECENCCGHPEVRQRNRLKKQQQLCLCRCHHQGRPAGIVEEPADHSSTVVRARTESPAQPKTLIMATSNTGQQ